MRFIVPLGFPGFFCLVGFLGFFFFLLVVVFLP